MSQDDSTNVAEPEPQLPDTSPASPSRRPGEMRSAAPALCLFCANLLLGAILLSGSLWPALFALPQPQRLHPGAVSTATAINAIDPQTTGAPAFQATAATTAQATAQATAHATTQATVSVPAKATATPSTATPPTPVTTSPTPVSTQGSEG